MLFYTGSKIVGFFHLYSTVTIVSESQAHGVWVLYEEPHMMYIQIFPSPCLMLGQQDCLYRDIFLHLDQVPLGLQVSMLALRT